MNESDRELMEAREMAIQAKGQAELALSRIESHEDICATRYAGIIDSMKSINGKLWYLVLSVAGSTIAALIGFILILLKNGVKI